MFTRTLTWTARAALVVLASLLTAGTASANWLYYQDVLMRHSGGSAPRYAYYTAPRYYYPAPRSYRGTTPARPVRAPAAYSVRPAWRYVPVTRVNHR
jgi:hypothetical protein